MSQKPEVETEARLEELRQALGRIGDQNHEPVVESETKPEEFRQAWGRVGDQDYEPLNVGLVSGNIYQASTDNSTQVQEVLNEEVNGTDIEIVKETKVIQGMHLPVSIQPGLYLTITPVTTQDFEVYGPLVIKRSDYYLRTTLREKVSGDLFFQPLDYRVVAYDVEKQKLYLTWEEGMPGR